MWRVDSLEKTLMLGGIGGRRRRVDRGWDGWMASPTWWTWVWVNSGSWWWTGRPGVLWFMGLQRVRHDWATELNLTGQIHTSVLASLLCPSAHPFFTLVPLVSCWVCPCWGKSNRDQRMRGEENRDIVSPASLSTALRPAFFPGDFKNASFISAASLTILPPMK